MKGFAETKHVSFSRIVYEIHDNYFEASLSRRRISTNHSGAILTIPHSL
jgi:hypothetical protein